MTTNSSERVRLDRYAWIISGASDWPRKITVAAYIDSTSVVFSSHAIAPPTISTTHWMTRR